MPARRGAPQNAFGFDLFGRSLSARVLWLAVSIILLVEVAILMPSLGRERESWLWQHLVQAQLAAYSAAMDPRLLAPSNAQALLQMADAASIELLQTGKPPVLIGRGSPTDPGCRVTLGQESLPASMWRADKLVMGLGSRWVEVSAPSTLRPNARIVILVNGRALAAHLQIYAAHVAALSVIIALVTGLLLFAALDRLLVRPMRIMTESIVGFRQAPEQSEESALDWLALQRNDEISEAARELKVMQDEMRAALWRNARLAAVGTAVAKISHDLRNILSSALLVADRLQETDDPATRRAARTLIPAVERAAQLVSRTVDFAREGPPAITRSAVGVHELVDEASLLARPEGSGVEIINDVSEALVLALDRAQMYRVLVNLMRNAIEAGATQIVVSMRIASGLPRMTIADNGPGLPNGVREKLFKPFTGTGRRGGTGLGLAIARDLIRAHGGELTLGETGPHGTVFVLDLASNDAG
jgi:signal transduction histidine kinase